MSLTFITYRLHAGTGPTLLSKVHCPYESDLQNAPQHILRCDYTNGSSSCNPDDQMAVECGMHIVQLNFMCSLTQLGAPKDLANLSTAKYLTVNHFSKRGSSI